MVANKQPYYHRATLLFTATRDVGQEELREILRNAVSRLSTSEGLDLIVESIEIEECDSEPGDPMDLMGGPTDV